MSYAPGVRRELERALLAMSEGNEGMARVCARRAVGAAVRAWLDRQPVMPEGRGRGSAVALLKAMREDASLPEPVRAAAARLSTTVLSDHTLPFDNSPVDDAQLIVEYFDSR